MSKEQKKEKKNADPAESVLLKAVEKVNPDIRPHKQEPKEEKQEKAEPETEIADPFGDGFFQIPVAKEEAGEKTAEEELEQKEEVIQKDERQDDDDVEIDVDELTNLRGQKITQKAADAFKIVKKKRDEWKQKALDLEKKLAERVESVGNVADSEEYKQLLAERDAYKAQLQEIDYGNSEEFKSKYVEPVSQVVQRINTLLPKNLTDSQKGQMAALASKASALAGIPEKEDEYFGVVDAISDRFFTGTLATRFQRAMDELWEKSVVLEDAKKSKTESAKKVLEDRKKQIEGSSDQFMRSIDEELSHFEKTEDKRVKVWNSDGFKDEIKYEEFKKTELAKAKEVLVDFAKTGRLSGEARKLLMVGVLGGVFAREKMALLKVIDLHHNQLKQARERVAELEESLKKRTSKIGDFSERVKTDEPDHTYENGKSIIHERIKKMRI